MGTAADPVPGIRAGTRAAVLVEGRSDQVALQALAERRGCPLAEAGVQIVPIGGATNIARFLGLLGPQGLGLRLAGLCDVAEEGFFRRGLERAGLGPVGSRGALEALGFHVCVRDLEDELIRCLGTAAVLRIIDAEGEARPFHSLQRQPAQRARSLTDQLHRFMGARSGRKELYARLLVEALDPDRVPPPLDGVLGHVCTEP